MTYAYTLGTAGQGPPLQPYGGPPPMPGPRSSTREAADDGGGSVAVNAVYLTQLAALAVELGAQGAGRCEPGAIRLLRQRLTQWIEDLRSVGGNGELASAVEKLIQRLTAALAAPANLAAEVTAIAEALAKLSTGAPPPPVKKKSRLAFWK